MVMVMSIEIRPHMNAPYSMLHVMVLFCGHSYHEIKHINSNHTMTIALMHED